MQVTKCDRCGAITDEPWTLRTLAHGNVLTLDRSALDGAIKDLCCDCAAGFETWWDRDRWAR